MQNIAIIHAATALTTVYDAPHAVEAEDAHEDEVLIEDAAEENIPEDEDEDGAEAEASPAVVEDDHETPNLDRGSRNPTNTTTLTTHSTQKTHSLTRHQYTNKHHTVPHYNKYQTKTPGKKHRQN